MGVRAIGLPPNNSFKPTPHRGVNSVLYATLHAVATPLRGGLTQALGTLKEIFVKYTELQKLINQSDRSDWLIHGNRLYVYKEDVALTIEIHEVDEQFCLSIDKYYPKLFAIFKYGNSLIEQWPLLQTYNRYYSEILPFPQQFFAIGAERNFFDVKRLDSVKRIFNQESQYEAYNQAVTDIVLVLENPQPVEANSKSGWAPA